MSGLVLSADVLVPVSSEPIRGGAMAIEKGRIVAVGNAGEIEAAYPDFVKTGTENSILLPGLVNAHTHLELGWTKDGIGDFDGFAGWLERIIELKSGLLDFSVYEDSAKEGLREIASCGVTTVGDVCSLGGAGAEMLRNSGMRAVAFMELFDRNLSEMSCFEFSTEDLYEERPFPHAPYSCGPKFLKVAFSRAGEDGIPMGMHLGESPDEAYFLRNAPNMFERKIFPLIGKEAFARPSSTTPTRYVDEIMGDRDAKLSVVHMVQTEAADMEVVRRRDMGMILCPRSNVFLEVGEPDLRLVAGWRRVGLGTDGLSSNADLDFFREMRSVRDMMIAQRVGDASRLSVYFATLGGARALFIEEKTGSLEVGKDADVLCIDSGKERNADPYLRILSSGPENVLFSMVKGRFIYRGRSGALPGDSRHQA